MIGHDQLIGEWRGSEEIAATPWGPVGTAEGTLRFARGPGEGLLLHEHESVRDGSLWLAGHGVLALDPLAWWWFDSLGFRPAAPAEVTDIDGGLRLVRTSPRGASVHTWLIDGGEFVHRIETRAGDGALVPLLDARYARA